MRQFPLCSIVLTIGLFVLTIIMWLILFYYNAYVIDIFLLVTSNGLGWEKLIIIGDGIKYLNDIKLHHLQTNLPISFNLSDESIVFGCLDVLGQYKCKRNS